MANKLYYTDNFMIVERSKLPPRQLGLILSTLKLHHKINNKANLYEADLTK